MKQLAQYIRTSIDINNGRISFYDYMNFCLYNPKTGFYNSDTVKFSKTVGDFFTLPEYGRLFAYCVALKLYCLFEKNVEKCLLEVGPGTGKFLFDIVIFLQQLGITIESIVVLEYSTFLREIQRNTFEHLKYNFKITWVKKIPYGFSGVIVCNEILDAIPFQGTCLQQNRIFERFVTYKDNKFTWIMGIKNQDIFTSYVKRFIVGSESITQFTEVFLFFNSFLCYLLRNLKTCVFYFFDYGYINTAYYDKKRYRGTLRCYYKKKTYNNPFLFPGVQDITAHVDFTSFIKLCKINNMDCVVFLRFYDFFMNKKINFFVRSVDASACCLKKLNDEFDLLLSTEKMGNIFKVVVLQKR